MYIVVLFISRDFHRGIEFHGFDDRVIRYIATRRDSCTDFQRKYIFIIRNFITSLFNFTSLKTLNYGY